MNDEGTTILCMKGERPTEKDIRGTTTDRCAKCGVSILVAPSGRELAEKSPPPVTLVCVPCGIEALGLDPDPKLHPPTKEQRDELAAHWEQRAALAQGAGE